MQTRRDFLAASVAFAGTATLATPTLASRGLPRRFYPRTVSVNPDLLVGRIYVINRDHYLYHVIGRGRARRYGVALGAPGRQFRGTAVISRKAKWPSWRPTANMIQVEPEVYGPYAAGLPGGHRMNPMGSRALYMEVAGRPTYYRIHGTHLPNSIGKSFSSGCIRLRNDHIDELYDQVPVGTIMHVF